MKLVISQLCIILASFSLQTEQVFYGGQDVAVFQRSTFNYREPSLAIDGDQTTCSQTGFDIGAWWRIDLGASKLITGVELTGFSDVPIQVRVGNESDATGRADGFERNPLCGFSDPFSDFLRVDCRQPIYGRVLSVKAVDPVFASFLNLCEVDVLYA